MLRLLEHMELLTRVWTTLDYALILDFVVVIVVVVVVVVVTNFEKSLSFERLDLEP